MTSTDRLAELAAEIERRRDEAQQVPVFSLSSMAMAMDEIRRLRARVAELEAIVAVGRGTMGMLMPDEPAAITHGHTPNAPPHDE